MTLVSSLLVHHWGIFSLRGVTPYLGIKEPNAVSSEIIKPLTFSAQRNLRSIFGLYSNSVLFNRFGGEDENKVFFLYLLAE